MESTELDAEFRALVDFARGSRVPTGFATMDAKGEVDLERPVELWISARMTHVFALAQMYGIPGTEELVAHGVNSLKKYFHDPVYGGWYSSIMATAAEDGNGVPVNDRKEAYAQAFVILAAASTLAAGNRDAGPLLEDALAQQEEHWLDPETGLVAESWDRSFTECEDYRGINANMHTVEAFLAAADVTGERLWLERAARIGAFAARAAEANRWRLPEHFDADWNALLEFNADRPADPFKPYGATVGHGLEWARLFLHLEAAGAKGADWAEAAVALFDRAVADGWDDERGGFVYTTDWEGTPVVADRMHWVVAEAIGAAATLWRRTGDERYARLYERYWDYAAVHLIDRECGSWRHQLDGENRPADSTWRGKPDLYHAAQATLIPQLPLAPTMASAIARGLLPS